jgi:hypothetical protein
MEIMEQMQSLMKALEAGSQLAAPGQLNQGASLQMEDLSPVMHNLTFKDKNIKLQKMVEKKEHKNTVFQFNRVLDYGIRGGSAQYEGNIGEEETSNYVRIVVPMAHYVTQRRVTLAANMVATFDGKKADNREAEASALKLAGDIEYDLFRGQADYSNNGVFDGNPLAAADMPGMIGLDRQVRQSDYQQNAQDLAFAEFGSSLSSVLHANGTLAQSIIEDASLRSAIAWGNANKLMVDEYVLSAYNKIAFAKERIVLAGSPQESTGAELRMQHTAAGPISVESSGFLRGKVQPNRPRLGALAAPASITVAQGSAGLSSLLAGSYVYYVTAENERGEGYASASQSVTISANYSITVTISAVAGARLYNVYRSAAGGSAATARFIGKIKQGISNPVFTDLGNRLPGSVTGFLVQGDSMELGELCPYTRAPLARGDLSDIEAHFRILALGCMAPRYNVLLDNLVGNL